MATTTSGVAMVTASIQARELCRQRRPARQLHQLVSSAGIKATRPRMQTMAASRCA